MSIRIIIALLVLGTLFLSAAFFAAWISGEQLHVSKPKQSMAIEMREYRNAKIGFSFSYPAETYGYGCVRDEFYGTHYQPSLLPPVPLAVYEDVDAGAIYLATQFVYYGRERVIQQTSKGTEVFLFRTCVKIPLEFAELTSGLYEFGNDQFKDFVSWRPTSPPIDYWQFDYRKVNDEAEIDAWVGERYGCAIIDREEVGGENVRLKIGQPAGSDQLSCFNMWKRRIVLYNKQTGLVVSWEPGEHPSFFGPDGRILDQAVIESFAFGKQ